jgi:hypothetical protein
MVGEGSGFPKKQQRIFRLLRLTSAATGAKCRCFSNQLNNMKNTLWFSFALFTAGSLLAADSSPKDMVTGAAAALGDQPNYSWHTTVENANNNGFRRGPTDGKTEKGGYTTYSLSFNDNTIEVVIKGTNGAIKTADNGWQSAAEAGQDNGGGFNPAMFIARMIPNYKAPAAEATSLASLASDLTAGTNGISGDLTEDSVKGMLTFRRNGGDGPTVSNAKGAITFGSPTASSSNIRPTLLAPSPSMAMTAT